MNLMTRMGENGRTKTGLCFLTFASNKIPDYVKVGYENVPVKPYAYKPMRCFTCQKFGHTSSRCIDKDNKFTCGKCSGAHETTKCTETIFKCANCGGPHQSGSAECSVLKKETEILAHMKEHAVGYGEAKRKVESLSCRPDTSYASALTNNNRSTDSVSKKLAEKDKEIAMLKSMVSQLNNQVKELTDQIKNLAASTQQQQRKEEESESRPRSHILPQVTPARDFSGPRSGSNRSSSAGRLPRGEEQDMEATVSKNSRERSPGSAGGVATSNKKKAKTGSQGNSQPHKT